MKPKQPYNRKLSNRQRMLDYLAGRLSAKEQHLFERHLMTDSFEAEALKGLSRLSPQEIADDLAQLDESISFRQNRKILPIIWKIASIILMLLVPASILWMLVTFVNKPPQIAQNKTESPIKVDSVISSEQKPAIQIQIEPKHEKQVKKTESVTIPVAEVKTVDENESIEIAIAQPIAKKEQMANEEAEQDSEQPLAITVDKQLQGRMAGVQLSESKKRERTIAPLPQLTFKGIVKDDTGEPLPGVTITWEGSSNGTITDHKGQFTITKPANQTNNLVTASYIGYSPAKTELSSDTSNTIIVKPDLLALNEVVVIGYGTETKMNETGSVSRIEMNTDKTGSIYTAPKPAIGINKYIKQIENQLQYPPSGSGKKESLILKIHISENGTINSIEILKSPGDDYTRTAIEAIKNGPIWLPAQQNGVNIPGTVRIKLQFTP